MYEKDKKKQPEISAKTVEEFQKINQLIQQLPFDVVEQIETARFCGVGVECVFEQQFSDRPVFNIIAPRQISDCGDYIAIYADNYVFKIIGANYTRKIFNYAVLEQKK